MAARTTAVRAMGVVCLIGSAAGCGGSSSGHADALVTTTQPTTTAVSGAASTPLDVAVDTTTALTGRAQTGATATTTTTARATTQERPPFPMQVSLASTCAVPGGVMEATIVTPPDAQLALVASYDDEDHTPDIEWVQSAMNPTGTYTWTWTLRPDTPLGPALLTTVAGHDGNGGSSKDPFEVQAAC